MLFTQSAHAGIAAGTITVTFRFWSRPQAKVGGRYDVGPSRIEVDAIELVPFSTVGDDEARQAGLSDRQALRKLISHAGPVLEETIVHRIDFHVVGPRGARVEAPVDDETVAAVRARLARLDANAPQGPWTATVLGLIGDQPGVVSTVLAEQVGRERLKFKTDVRKLKALGLTESLEVGYRLTSLGEALRPAPRTPSKNKAKAAKRRQ